MKRLRTNFEDPGWRIQLGEKLKEHLFFQNLLKVLGGRIFSFDTIFLKLENITKGLKSNNAAYKIKYAEQPAGLGFGSPH